MIKLNKAQSVSIATGNPHETIRFYSEVLGFSLIAIQREKSGVRVVMRVGDDCEETTFSLYFDKAIAASQPVVDVSESRDPIGVVAPGALQHFAFTCPDLDALDRLVARIRRNGIWVIGPLDHGFCHSAYCKGPEGIVFEFATDHDPTVDTTPWLDPKTAQKHGVSLPEMQRLNGPS